MMKVRTATKKDFTGDCRHTIQKGEQFLLVEPRPLFYCRACADRSLEEIEQDMQVATSAAEEKA